MTRLYCRLLNVLLWLAERIWGIPPAVCQKPNRVFFYKIRRKDGSYTTGDIMADKVEIGFNEDIFGATDRPYQVGTAQWVVMGKDKDGNDISNQATLTVDPNNELNATLKQLTEAEGGTEGVFTAMVSVDADPDDDESSPLDAVLTLVADAPNASVITLTHSPHVEV